MESVAQACRIHALFLILHSGNILDQGAGEPGSKQADVQTLASTFDAVARVHFPEALGHVALRLVPCPPICATAYALVSKYVLPPAGGTACSQGWPLCPSAALGCSAAGSRLGTPWGHSPSASAGSNMALGGLHFCISR